MNFTTFSFVFLLAFQLSLAKYPNIIYILADDAGYGDSAYSLPNNSTHGRIRTDNLQKLAESGMRFINGYTGPICSPSRNTLMTGQHMGHTTIRGNSGSFSPLENNQVTVANLLKKRGYYNGIIGKWNLGDFGSSGYPLNQGFDYYVGADNAIASRNWYPSTINLNLHKKEKIHGNEEPNWHNCGPMLDNCTWIHDYYTQKAKEFIKDNAGKENPFFLYLNPTAPHAGMINNEQDRYPIPEHYRQHFSKFHWPEFSVNYSATVYAVDVMIGQVVKKLEDLNILEDTIIFYSSDNGPDDLHHDVNFFDSRGPFRGWKESLYEGGIRQQILVSWPGTIKEYSESDHIFALWDFLPTVAEIADIDISDLNIDGISAVPALYGENQLNHSEIYYELCQPLQQRQWDYGGGWIQSYRNGSFKGIRSDRGKLILYDLSIDEGEQNDISHVYPSIVLEFEEAMDSQHQESYQWPSTNDHINNPCCTGCDDPEGCDGCPASRTRNLVSLIKQLNVHAI